nr:MAG TPA: protein of unknown function (DUF4713) [Caudoviricetes sp.]
MRYESFIYSRFRCSCCCCCCCWSRCAWIVSPGGCGIWWHLRAIRRYIERVKNYQLYN